MNLFLKLKLSALAITLIVVLLAGSTTAQDIQPEPLGQTLAGSDLPQISPRSIALGATSSTLIDDWSLANNPAGLGLYYQDHRASLSFLWPGNIDSSPQSDWPAAYAFIPTENRSFSMISIGGRLYNSKAESSKWKSTIALAASRMQFSREGAYANDNYITRWGGAEAANATSSYSNSSNVNMLGISYALTGPIDFSFGLTGKFAGSGNGHANVGLILSDSWGPAELTDRASLQTKASVGLLLENLGGSLRKVGSDYSLNQHTKIGIDFFLNWKNTKRTILSVRTLIEYDRLAAMPVGMYGTGDANTNGYLDTDLFWVDDEEQWIVKDGDTIRVNQYGYDFKQYQNFDLGEFYNRIHLGLEAGLYDAFFVRLGSQDQGYDRQLTYGLGLNINNVLQTFDILQNNNGLLGWMSSHVELTYDFASFQPINHRSNFHRFTLAIL